MLLVVVLPFFLAETEEILSIESSISPLRLSRGEEGKVILKFNLREGTKISPQPSFVIEFMPNEELVFPKNFFTASDLDIEVLEEKGRGYLNLNRQIEIPFTVSLKAKRGIHTLVGKVKYFALSMKEGWCLKSSSKFSATYSTRLTIKKR